MEIQTCGRIPFHARAVSNLAIGTFLSLRGADTREIMLLGNNLARARRLVERGDDVPADAVHLTGNR